MTLPGRPAARGRLHPTTQTLREIYRVFGEMGFQVYRSREVETDEYNFQLLNIPPNHPAREMWDTFYVDTGQPRGDNPICCARTPRRGRSASCASTRLNPRTRRRCASSCRGCATATSRSAPARRSSSTRSKGWRSGTDITLGDLKGTLSDFARRMFGAERAHPLPRLATSPSPSPAPRWTSSASCAAARAARCASAPAGWRSWAAAWSIRSCCATAATTRERYTGFAFGMGPERITMLRHQIEDIRYFWANDLRFLEQF